MKIIFLIFFTLFIILFICFRRKKQETFGTFKSPEQLEQIYKTFTPIFSQFDFFIFYGTLLGYVREYNFIKNDDDIDVLIDYKKKEDVYKVIRKKKLRINEQKEYFVQLYKNNIGPFDIYFYEIKNEYIHIPWMNAKYPTTIIFPLQNTYYKTENIKIPHNPVAFLESYYGKDWRIPQQKKMW